MEVFFVIEIANKERIKKSELIQKNMEFCLSNLDLSKEEVKDYLFRLFIIFFFLKKKKKDSVLFMDIFLNTFFFFKKHPKILFYLL